MFPLPPRSTHLPYTTLFRSEHPKQHAGVWARFAIERDIPSGFRVGIFKDPRTYTALIRYSNGRTFDDRLPDVHGRSEEHTSELQSRQTSMPSSAWKKKNIKS